VSRTKGTISPAGLFTATFTSMLWYCLQDTAGTQSQPHGGHTTCKRAGSRSLR
jgi:hypothetical protein